MSHRVIIKTTTYTLDASVSQEVAKKVFDLVVEELKRSPVRVEWTLGPVTLRVKQPSR